MSTTSGGARRPRPASVSKKVGITTVHIPVELYGLGIESHAGLGVIALAWSFEQQGKQLYASNGTLADVFRIERSNFLRVMRKLRKTKMVKTERISGGRAITVTARIRKLLASVQPDTSEDTGSVQHDTSASVQPDTKLVSNMTPKGKRREIKGRGKKPAPEKFTRPTVSQIADYAAEQGYPDFDAAWFVTYYTERDWQTTKGRSIQNWKLTVLTWIRRDKKDTEQTSPQPDIGMDRDEADRIFERIRRERQTA